MKLPFKIQQSLQCYKIKYTVPVFITFMAQSAQNIYVKNSFLFHHRMLTFITSQQYHEAPEQLSTPTTNFTLNISTPQHKASVPNLQITNKNLYRSKCCLIIKPELLRFNYNIKSWKLMTVIVLRTFLVLEKSYIRLQVYASIHNKQP